MRQAKKRIYSRALDWMGMQTLPLPLLKPLHRFNYVERSIHKYSDGFAIDTRKYFFSAPHLLRESIIAHYFGIQLI